MKTLLLQHPSHPLPGYAQAFTLAGLELGTCPPDADVLPAAGSYILGDVTAAQMPERMSHALLRRIQEGAGLLVTGGAAGLSAGGWSLSPLQLALPVRLDSGDDLEHAPSGVFLRRRNGHPICDGLPWDQPPVVTSFHRVRPRPGAEIVIEGSRILAMGLTTASLSAKTEPVLVLGMHGEGRVAVIAADLGGPFSLSLRHWGPALPSGSGEPLGSAFCRLVTRLVSFLDASADEARLDPWSAARVQPDHRRMLRTFPTAMAR